MKNSNTAKRQLTYRRVWGLIENYRSIKQMSMSELAIRIHCSTQTVSNRRDKPDALSLEELMQYKEALNIPDRELAEAIIGKRIIQMEENQ